MKNNRRRSKTMQATENGQYSQMTLIEYKPNINEMHLRIEDLQLRYDRLRKSLQAKNSKLENTVTELKMELEYIKAGICKRV